MKTYLKIFLLLIIGLSVLFSCEKENTKEISNEIGNEEHPISLKYLVINAPSYGSYFANINKVLSVNLMTTTLRNHKIDINNDSIYDLEFSTDVWHHTMRYIWSSTVKTLNNDTKISLATKEELFAHYFSIYINPSDSDSIKISYVENYNSKNTYPSNLRIDTLKGVYPKIYSQGDTLLQNANWNSGNFILEYSEQEESTTKSNFKRGIWYGINNKFIGIQFSKADKQYLGWIEISVNNFRISLKRYYFKVNKY